ncbi:MAG: (2Fe-2S)-binding protein [Bacteroidetes Order II. Incertae sedis bacterium]|nr:(2Fe-2S)-binding protein [Bacteroidetes Order II. bacterium]
MKTCITRCVCYRQPFDRLKAIAEAHHLQTVEALQEVALFGENCGLCKPYVAQMLRTGQTVFTELLIDNAYGQTE